MPRTNYYLKVTLIVTKSGNRESAEREVIDRLDEWFRERLTPPYPAGTLVHYEIDPGVVTVEVDDSGHTVTASKTV